MVPAAVEAPAAPSPAPPVRSTPLAELRLPKRVHTSLARDGVETIEQLTARTQAEVLELKGIGASSLHDILTALDRAGRALRYPQSFTRIG
jgi:DNA-directed RNA polymerase alpha subunit